MIKDYSKKEKVRSVFLLITVLFLLIAGTTGYALTTYENQKNHVELRFGMFIHFNMGTFHDAEWVDPGQDPLSFNPAGLDCNQWAAAAKSAGMTYAVLTTKHHDGFCLWPSAYTTYDVMSSSYPYDIVQKYVTAFRAAGLTPCFYFSIWDRQQGVDYGSVSAEDIVFVKNQLTELLSNYGEIPILIIDGWSWAMGHKMVPYGEIREHIKSLQPNCLIVDLNGLTEPWDTDVIFFEEPKGIWAPAGNTYASCQGNNIVSTGWFWHPSTPTATCMTVSDIVTTHLKTLEPRYCNFLLNCPPNTSGLLDTNIVTRLAEVGAAWVPDSARAALPAQPDVLEHPVSASSSSATSGDSTLAVDGKHDCNYQTIWQSSTSLPQSVTIDLGNIYSGLDMFVYTPSQFTGTGFITSYSLELSSDGSSFIQVASGTWAANKIMKRVRFSSSTGRYVRLVASAAQDGYAIASEILAGAYASAPSGGGTSAPTTPPSDTMAPTADPTTPPSDTLAPTDVPAATSAPTDTPAPTSIPTATPAGVTADPTTPPSDTVAPTPEPTTPPGDTAAPTTPPSATNPPSTGCTCTNLCTSQTAITIPFTYDGVGEYCWTSSSLGTYVSSWNCDAVNVNGTNCTNIYISSSSIAAINGVYYIYYKGSYAWSHIEIK